VNPRFVPDGNLARLRLINDDRSVLTKIGTGDVVIHPFRCPLPKLTDVRRLCILEESHEHIDQALVAVDEDAGLPVLATDSDS